jgi:single-strand DNA-binding protein
MKDINQITLTGCVGKTPMYVDKVKYPNWIKFSLAVSDSYKDKSGEWQNTTEWFECKTNFDWQAKAIEKSVDKGTRLTVTGSVKQGNAYINKEGKPVGVIELSIASFVVPIVSKEEGSKQQTTTSTSRSTNIDNIIDDDEIPF